MPTAPKANPKPITSPWVWETYDTPGRVLRVTIAFDETTRLITGISSYRDPGCDFTTLVIGLGADGRPNTTDKSLDVPEGNWTAPASRLAALAARGLSTIEQVQSFQITAE